MTSDLFLQYGGEAINLLFTFTPAHHAVRMILHRLHFVFSIHLLLLVMLAMHEPPIINQLINGYLFFFQFCLPSYASESMLFVVIM
jgi:hypothetical protein